MTCIKWLNLSFLVLASPVMWFPTNSKGRGKIWWENKGGDGLKIKTVTKVNNALVCLCQMLTLMRILLSKSWNWIVLLVLAAHRTTRVVIIWKDHSEDKDVRMCLCVSDSEETPYPHLDNLPGRSPKTSRRETCKSNTWAAEEHAAKV